MIDVHQLRKHTEDIALVLAKRGFILDVEAFNTLEFSRKNMQSKLEELQARMNKSSQMIGRAKAQGMEVGDLLEDLAKLSSEIKHFDHEAGVANAAMDDFLHGIPNLPHEDVPLGRDENDNVEITSVGNIPSFDFDIKDHVDLCSKAMSFEQGILLAKSRFVVLHAPLSTLNRALTQWMLDTHISRGYHEVNIPLLANKDSLFGTSQLPKFGEDLYSIEDEDLYLIPTSEVTLTNIHRKEILKEEDLGKKYVAYSACFRKEAGSYGKDTRGLIRQHQFEKVELVQWVLPEDGIEAHESLTQDAEYLLQALELPYRKMLLCGGDMGFASSRTYDLEVWVPSQDCYREISSCSLFTDFQSRRMKTRVKRSGGKTELPYTLNGSGLALGRTMVAILENYQQANGDVIIPTVLRPYMGNKERLLASELV